MLGGIAALLTAGAAVGASFAPVYHYSRIMDRGDGDPSEFAQDPTWWSRGTTAGFETPESGLLLGIPLVVAAALLVVAAVLLFLAASARRPGTVTASRTVSALGAGMLAGVVTIVLFDALDFISLLNEDELAEGESLELQLGLGMWLPLGAVLLGAATVVLAHLGPPPQDPRVEPETPSMGVRMPQFAGPVPPGVQPAPGPATPVPGPPMVPPPPAAAPVAPEAAGTRSGAAEQPAPAAQPEILPDERPTVAEPTPPEPDASPTEPAPPAPEQPTEPAPPTESEQPTEPAPPAASAPAQQPPAEQPATDQAPPAS